MPPKEYIPQGLAGSTEEVVYTNQLPIIAGSFVESKYQDAKSARMPYQNKWQKLFLQFRGDYSPEEMAQLRLLKEKNPYASEAFIKISKVKSLAAIGSIYEALFAGNEVPISVEETPEPEGVAKKVHIDLLNSKDSVAVENTEVDDIASAIGYPGDGKTIERGATFKDLFSGLGTKYQRLFKNGTLLKEGDSPDPINAVEIHPAKEAALRMNSLIQDQLTEADTKKKIELMIWELVVLGTGVLKGPHTHKEIINGWKLNEDTKVVDYNPSTKLRPHLQNVSIWNIFPDPHAETVDDISYVVERHKMSRSKLSTLSSQAGFNKEFIQEALRRPSNLNVNPNEEDLRDAGHSPIVDPRYEVLEFWGDMDYTEATSAGVEGLPNVDNEETAVVSVNIWTVNGVAIKAVVNPFTPERIPYYFVRYEINPYQLWGMGIPENMEDAQAMINVHTRAAQDNLRLAGSTVLEINESFLAPGWDPTIYAGKVFIKRGGSAGQAIHSINFNNVAPAHFQMIGEANRYADQTTLPSIMHGQTGIAGTGRTAFGMSALMNSGSLAIRTVLKNIDRELLKPLGDALFNWNMQFNTDLPEIRGDLKIVTKGSAALSMKEVQSQRLLSFLQMSANPLVAPFVNVPTILKGIAVALDLDPDDVINDPDQARLYAQILGEQSNGLQNGGAAQQGIEQTGTTGNGGVGGTDQINDAQGVGGGNIGDRVGSNTGQTAIT